MRTISIADIVFFMVASTLCYMAIIWQITGEQFLWIAGIVFWSFYVHKANQNKVQSEPNTSSTTTTTNLDIESK